MNLDYPVFYIPILQVSYSVAATIILTLHDNPCLYCLTTGVPVCPFRRNDISTDPQSNNTESQAQVVQQNKFLLIYFVFRKKER
jgi:hypothetical protein